MPATFADKVIEFNHRLRFAGQLPGEFRVLNPFSDQPETLAAMEAFYHKYYQDNNFRKFIIGINPGRYGAGVTGVPFTDTKRLKSECGIEMKTVHTHEISSVFIYDMISAYGGTKTFYSRFYINSPFPLAILRQVKNGKWVNANYYDDQKLFEAVEPFMIATLKKHIRLGLNTDEVYVLGKKNERFLQKINQKEKLFDKMRILEHPRFIQQYKLKERNSYNDKYILTLQDSAL